jgi:hypothetical protein
MVSPYMITADLAKLDVKKIKNAKKMIGFSPVYSKK